MSDYHSHDHATAWFIAGILLGIFVGAMLTSVWIYSQTGI